MEPVFQHWYAKFGSVLQASNIPFKDIDSKVGCTVTSFEVVN